MHNNSVDDRQKMSSAHYAHTSKLLIHGRHCSSCEMHYLRALLGTMKRRLLDLFRLAVPMTTLDVVPEDYLRDDPPRLGCGTRSVVLFTSRVRHHGEAAKLVGVYTYTQIICLGSVTVNAHLQSFVLQYPLSSNIHLVWHRISQRHPLQFNMLFTVGRDSH